jgi:hypothetical protein
MKFTTPSIDLLRELLNVAESADSLSNHVATANHLPPNFPKAQTISLCQVLSNLPKGTSEGCREPLIYARMRLPALRREYILDQQEAHTVTEHDLPAVRRGEELDQRISELAIAVGTALDQYQVDASETVFDYISTDKQIDAREIADTSETIKRSSALESDLNSALREIEKTTKNPSEKFEQLERQVRDAEAHNRTARTELMMPRTRVGWIRPVIDKLRLLPTVIRQTGTAIEAATDVAGPMVERWDAFWSNFSQFTLSEIKLTAGALGRTADKLDHWLGESQLRDNAKLGSGTAKEKDASDDRRASGRRGTSFSPRSRPTAAFDAFSYITTYPSEARENLEGEFGVNPIRDLVSLGLIRKEEKNKMATSLNVDVSDPSIAFRYAASSMPTIRVAVEILQRNPDTLPIEIGEIVALRTGQKWPQQSTLRRIGNSLRRWVFWIDPNIANEAKTGEALAARGEALRSLTSKGRPSKITPERVTELRAMLESGKTIREIARKFGVTSATIQNWKRKNN